MGRLEIQIIFFVIADPNLLIKDSSIWKAWLDWDLESSGFEILHQDLGRLKLPKGASSFVSSTFLYTNAHVVSKLCFVFFHQSLTGIFFQDDDPTKQSRSAIFVSKFWLSEKFKVFLNIDSSRNSKTFFA